VAPEKSKRQAEFSPFIESKISVMRDPMPPEREARTGREEINEKERGRKGERERGGDWKEAVSLALDFSLLENPQNGARCLS